MEARSITQSRRVAKTLTGILWLIGSAYLVNTEYQSASPDPMIMIATPFVWAAVIALPVIAGHALAQRQAVAALLLTMAALIGMGYTLSGTLGRQAEARDTRVATADDVAKQRVALQAKLDTNERELDGARRNFGAECSRGVGKNCAGIERVIGLYETAIKAQRADLATLKVAAPAAGEKRIAALIGLVLDRPAADIERAVGLVLPALFGMLVELGALACAMYGWSPNRPVNGSAGRSDTLGQSDFPALTPAQAGNVLAFVRPSGDDRDGEGGAAIPRDPKGPRPSDGRKERVLASITTDLALKRRFPSQRDLCERFGVPKSTMSDWLSEWEAAGLVPERRTIGRCKSLATA